MSKFSRISVNLSTVDPSLDSGISVKETLELLRGSEFYDELFRLFEIDSIIGDFINIKGARTLVSDIIKKDEEFVKKDINAMFKDVSINNFNELDSIDVKIDYTEENYGKGNIIAETIYSAKSDFLDDLFSLGKFTEYCIKKNCKEIITDNIENLKEKFGSDKIYTKRYRILTDFEGKCYLRALTSTSRYHDYNIRISVFVALIILHLNSKSNIQKYIIRNYVYNESYLNVYFENTDHKPIWNRAFASYIIELSNDEIKKEALRFSGLYNIYVEDDEKVGSFYIKPNSSKSSILAIKHSSTLNNVVEHLKELQERSISVENEMFADILKISTIVDADQIRHLIKSKIDNSTKDELKKYKNELSSKLVEKVNNIYELLKAMDKVYLVIKESDLDAKEYLMYVLYSAITQTEKINSND